MSCRVPTLSLQFGELLGQNVLTLLQLPLLLLHVLHVVSQRLDLGLVLHTEETNTNTSDGGKRRERFLDLDKRLADFRREVAVHLRDEQLTGRQLLLIGLDLAVGVGLSALQLLAAVHQRLHLRLHLTDVETGQSELLLHRRAVPLRL